MKKIAVGDIINDSRYAKASDVMTQYVFYIDADKTVADAIKLMREERLSSLVVNGTTSTDSWGIVTRKDIVSKVVGPGKDPYEVKIAEIMSKPLITVSPDLSVQKCAQIMRTKGIRRVAVYDGIKIIGLLSNTDIFNVIKI